MLLVEYPPTYKRLEAPLCQIVRTRVRNLSLWLYCTTTIEQAFVAKKINPYRSVQKFCIIGTPVFMHYFLPQIRLGVGKSSTCGAGVFIDTRRYFRFRGFFFLLEIWVFEKKKKNVDRKLPLSQPRAASLSVKLSPRLLTLSITLISSRRRWCSQLSLPCSIRLYLWVGISERRSTTQFDNPRFKISNFIQWSSLVLQLLFCTNHFLFSVQLWIVNPWC